MKGKSKSSAPIWGGAFAHVKNRRNIEQKNVTFILAYIWSSAFAVLKDGWPSWSCMTVCIRLGVEAAIPFPSDAHWFKNDLRHFPFPRIIETKAKKPKNNTRLACHSLEIHPCSSSVCQLKHYTGLMRHKCSHTMTNIRRFSRTHIERLAIKTWSAISPIRLCP